MPFLSLMTLTFDYDIQTRLSVFPVNLAQIRSAVAEIFHTQKSHRQRQKNRTLRSSLRACGNNNNGHASIIAG